MFPTKRVILFAGHYGSGKTNIAVNYAMKLAKEGRQVTIADLDIVNPYFRTKDSAQELEAAGIRLIVSPYANTNVDVPALPQELYAVTEDRERTAILDIGGDDRGALALGRYAPSILQENDYEMLFVFNASRPLTQDAASALDIMREIEEAGGIAFTGIVNNTNLGPLTQPDDILASLRYAEELSQVTGLPVKMTCAKDSLCQSLNGRVENLFPLSLQKLYYEIKSEVPYGEINI